MYGTFFVCKRNGICFFVGLLIMHLVNVRITFLTCQFMFCFSVVFFNS